jgi:hypothetical protein
MAAAADSTLTRHEPARNEPIGDDYGSAPVSGRLLRRTAIVYVALLALGLLPVIVHAPASYQAAGLGLLFPGGGFLAIGGWGYLLFAGSLLLMLLATALMLLTANVAAPLLIWLGSALLSATLAGWQHRAERSVHGAGARACICRMGRLHAASHAAEGIGAPGAPERVSAARRAAGTRAGLAASDTGHPRADRGGPRASALSRSTAACSRPNRSKGSTSSSSFRLPRCDTR